VFLACLVLGVGAIAATGSLGAAVLPLSGVSGAGTAPVLGALVGAIEEARAEAPAALVDAG